MQLRECKLIEMRAKLRAQELREKDAAAAREPDDDAGEAPGLDPAPHRLDAPGYSSGLVLILREPHFEHFMCLPTSGTGVSADSGAVAGFTSRSWPHSQQ